MDDCFDLSFGAEDVCDEGFADLDGAADEGCFGGLDCAMYDELSVDGFFGDEEVSSDLRINIDEVFCCEVAFDDGVSACASGVAASGFE